MPKYVLIHGQFYELTNNDLYHHGKETLLAKLR